MSTSSNSKTGEVCSATSNHEELKNELKDEEEYPVEEEALEIRRVLSAQVKEDTLSNNMKIFSILTAMLIIRFVV